MAIVGDQDRASLDRLRGNPHVVNGNGCTGLNQRRFDLAKNLGCLRRGVQHMNRGLRQELPEELHVPAHPRSASERRVKLPKDKNGHEDFFSLQDRLPDLPVAAHEGCVGVRIQQEGLHRQSSG
jgi:hypothetical protein